MTKHGGLSIQEFEKIYPSVTRRTLQRELRELVDKDIVETSGATSKLTYKLKSE
jgi:DNA-binding HxlR family transcriptional regulator